MQHIIIIVLLIYMGLYLINIAPIISDRAKESDFAHYYIATDIYSSGTSPYSKNLAPLHEEYGFNKCPVKERISPYPPFFFFIFKPFASLNITYGFIAWLALEILCLFYLLLLTKTLLKSKMPVKGWVIFSMVIIGSSWTISHFFFSQVGLLLAALVLSAFILNKKEKYALACVLISMAGMIKLFPFALLPWFIWRTKTSNWYRFKLLCISLGSIIFIILITGYTNWIDYYQISMQQQTSKSYGILFNFSLPSFLVNTVLIIKNFQLSPAWASFCNYLALSSGILIIAISYIFCLYKNKNFDLEFCLLTVVMLLGNIRTFGHYFVFLIFPMAMAFVMAFSANSLKKILWISLIFIALNLHHLIFVWPAWLSPVPKLYMLYFLNYIPMLGLLGLLHFFYKAISDSSFSSVKYIQAID